MSTASTPEPDPRSLSDDQLRREFLEQLAGFWHRRRKRLLAASQSAPARPDSDQQH